MSITLAYPLCRLCSKKIHSWWKFDKVCDRNNFAQFFETRCNNTVAYRLKYAWDTTQKIRTGKCSFWNLEYYRSMNVCF